MAGQVVICSAEGCGSRAAYVRRRLCKKHYNAAYHESRRAEIRERQKAYYDANREAMLEKSQRWFLANREKARVANRQHFLRKQFGMTLADYDRLYENQGGVCAICGGPERVEGRRLAVDHSHATGKVRALLCARCNQTLGRIGEDPTIAIRMAQYIFEHDESLTPAPKRGTS